MKYLLFSSLLCLGISTAQAQEALFGSRHSSKEEITLKEVANTLKERTTLEGYLQVGYSFDDQLEKSNSFDFNRAILMARGKITDQWSCYFMYSFAGTSKVLEAYTEYRFLPGLHARLGQFKTPYTIENPLSPCVTELVSCYSQAVAYLTGTNNSNPLYGNQGGRDLGLMIYGNLFNNFLSYNLAVMNGQGINQKDKNNQKDIVGKLMLHPLKWLSVGGSFIQGKGHAIAASAVNPEVAAGENYTRNRWAASASIRTRLVNVRTEYLAGKDKQVKSEGYYCTASLRLFPKFDVVASYDYLNRNKALSDKQSNYVAGIQYWFYPKCRLQAQYTYRDPKLGEASNFIQTQIQVRF